MNLLEIIILGIVEGLTEYLPVSSTGHLLLTESLLNMSQSKEALDALAVCIQGGAILAVLSLYFPRVKAMAQGVRGNNPAGLKLLVNLILAFLPAAVVGLCCASLIKEYLFNTYTVAYSWIVGGGVILAYCAWRARGGRSNEGDSGQGADGGRTPVRGHDPRHQPEPDDHAGRHVRGVERGSGRGVQLFAGIDYPGRGHGP